MTLLHPPVHGLASELRRRSARRSRRSSSVSRLVADPGGVLPRGRHRSARAGRAERAAARARRSRRARPRRPRRDLDRRRRRDRHRAAPSRVDPWLGVVRRGRRLPRLRLQPRARGRPLPLGCWFALAWGAFPVLTAYFAAGRDDRGRAVLGAVFATRHELRAAAALDARCGTSGAASRPWTGGSSGATARRSRVTRETLIAPAERALRCDGGRRRRGRCRAPHHAGRMIAAGRHAGRPVAGAPSDHRSGAATRFRSAGFVARLPAGTRRVVFVVGGHRKAARPAHGGRDTFRVRPSRARRRPFASSPSTRRGRERASAQVGPVLRPAAGCGAAADRIACRRQSSRGGSRSSSRLSGQPRAATCKNLVTGKGAAWNARARFPAGSTLKLAIAVEALRSLRGPPGRGIEHRRAHALDDHQLGQRGREPARGRLRGLDERRLGACQRDDALARARRQRDVRRLRDRGTPAPRRRSRSASTSSPRSSAGKYTTAADLGRLLQYVYLAAGGRGPAHLDATAARSHPPRLATSCTCSST